MAFSVQWLPNEQIKEIINYKKKLKKKIKKKLLSFESFWMWLQRKIFPKQRKQKISHQIFEFFLLIKGIFSTMKHG